VRKYRGAKSTISPLSTINWLAAIVSAERSLYVIISREGDYVEIKRAGNRVLQDG
jgi:hypothetical protein